MMPHISTLTLRRNQHPVFLAKHFTDRLGPCGYVEANSSLKRSSTGATVSWISGCSSLFFFFFGKSILYHFYSEFFGIGPYWIGPTGFFFYALLFAVAPETECLFGISYVILGSGRAVVYSEDAVWESISVHCKHEGWETRLHSLLTMTTQDDKGRSISIWLAICITTGKRQEITAFLQIFKREREEKRCRRRSYSSFRVLS
jgi:hypothetical protein